MRAICFAFVFLLAVFSAAQQASLDAPKVATKIHSLTLEGAGGIDVQSIVREIEALNLGYEYSCSDGHISDVIRERFQQYGYFTAEVAKPTCTTLRRDTHQVWIDVRVRVRPGAVYRLQRISFSGSSALTSDELRKKFPLRDGDLFRVDAMRAGLKNLREIYCRMGYAEFSAVPDTQIDEAQKGISVLLDLDEGEKFSYGDLVVNGEESVDGASKRLAAVWNGYRGKPYDCGASLESFLRDIHALPSIRPDDVFKSSSDHQRHTVTVTITLAKPIEIEVGKKQ